MRLPAGLTVTGMRRSADGLSALTMDLGFSRKLVHSYATWLWAFGGGA